MPFDGTQTAPSLQMLSDILRDKSRWPKGFKWNYGDCDACAMGLAHQLWRKTVDLPYTGRMAEVFNMPHESAATIFLNLSKRHHKSRQNITPAQVANAIDRYLATER